MSLPLVASSQPALRTNNTIHFSKGASVVTYPLPIKGKKKKYCDREYLGIMLEESSEELKGTCYRLICEKLNREENNQLRALVTESSGKVTFQQVSDFGGFGVVAITPESVKPGSYVLFEYFPRVDGKLLRSPIRLGLCNVGVVVAP